MSENSEVSHPTQAVLLQRYLQRERDNLVRTLDGLSDYDVRRPMTPTGTSLLGLVKHVASVELGYLGVCVGRPPGIDLPWDNEEGYRASADMWATAEESREFILDLYRRSWAHGDESIATLGLDAAATVPWWPEERRETTLGYLVVHLLAETAHHAGHADIVREMIDGRGGNDREEVGDEAWWHQYVARIQAQADAHRDT
jgi:uncharacterized damage-inducible protein DinB